MLVIELLNLINVVGNIFFLDAFLGGEFSAYGIEVNYIPYVVVQGDTSGSSQPRKCLINVKRTSTR